MVAWSNFVGEYLSSKESIAGQCSVDGLVDLRKSPHLIALADIQSSVLTMLQLLLFRQPGKHTPSQDVRSSWTEWRRLEVKCGSSVSLSPLRASLAVDPDLPQKVRYA